MKIFLLPSCIADRLGVGGRRFPFERLVEKHKDLFVNELFNYIPSNQDATLGQVQDNIKYAVDYLLPNDDNPFGIIDLSYCNLPQGCSITPLTKFTDYEEKNKQDAVLKYIEDILIINTHLHLMGSTLLIYMKDRERLNNNPEVQKMFRQADAIACKARMNFMLGMTFADAMYQAQHDIFKGKERFISRFTKIGAQFLPGCNNADSRKKHSHALTSLNNTNEIMKIVYEQYKNQDAKLAITGAQYMHGKRFEILGIQHKAIELNNTVGKAAAAKFYVEVAILLEKTQASYTTLLNAVCKNSIPDAAMLEEIKNAYVRILGETKHSLTSSKEAYKVKINDCLSDNVNQESRKSVLEDLNNKLACLANKHRKAMLPVDVMQEINEGNSEMLQAVNQVRCAHLLAKDPAREAIDRAFENAKATPMPGVDELVEAIEGWKSEKDTERSKTRKQKKAKCREKEKVQKTNQKKITKSPTKHSNKVDHSAQYSKATLDKKNEEPEGEKISLQSVSVLHKRFYDKGYKLDLRILRWSGATSNQIREFDKDKKYANRSEEDLTWQKAVHDLEGAQLLLFANDHEDYFFETPKGKSVFATLEVDGTIYEGMLEIGISDKKVIYHLMFNDKVRHKPEQFFQITDPILESSLEDLLDNDTQSGQWCNKDGFEIAKKGDTYVITLGMSTDPTRAIQQPCRRLYIHPNKLSMKCVGKQLEVGSVG